MLKQYDQFIITNLTVFPAFFFSIFSPICDLLDHFEELGFAHFDIPGNVPREMYDGHDGFVGLQPIPLVPLSGQLVLLPRDGTHIPGDVIAPALKHD